MTPPSDPIFLPPAPGLAAEGAPRAVPAGVTLLRVLGVVQTFHVLTLLAYAGIVGGTAAGAGSAASEPIWIVVAGLLVIAGLAGLGCCVVVIAAPRRPWFHTAGLVFTALSMMCGCWPLAIAVLVMWLRPEVQEWCRR
ncbi:MAG: hypothetical protein IT376_21395 [Polyangiaceae bacterium]|nr:hypothetical protein [Polyangiaceae bacterium]